MIELTSHETLQVLQELVPEAIAAGGSFATSLPHPRTLAASDRATALASARRTAVDQCIRTLLLRARIDETRSISTGDGGQREWPRGFLGSLTHKGTVVLGIIAASSTVAMIGIDLDRRGRGRSELSAVQHIVAPEGLPPGTDPECGALLSFCAKEAVFKAQYPLTRRLLNFSEVGLAWARSGDNLRAEVISPVSGLIVRAAFVGDWVLAVAISSLKPPQ